MTVKRLAMIAGAIAMLAAGTYVFVYLYRWEWHRAMTAGVIFLAAELGLGVIAVMDRIRRLERRLDGMATAHDLDRVLRRVEEAQPEPHHPFAWLRTDGEQMGVFVPILLGAGVLMSAAAWVVERVARSTATPMLERGLALRLAPLTFPAGSLSGAPVTVTLPRRPQRAAGWLGVLLVGGTLTGFAIDGLADLTQDRPDVVAPTSVSVLTLQVESRTFYNDGGSVAVARTVWAACTSQLRRHRIPEMIDRGGGRVEAIVRPALGPKATARMGGCLRDGAVDRLRVELTGITHLDKG